MEQFSKNFEQMRVDYANGMITRDKVIEKFAGWLAYAEHANTYNYRRHLVRQFNLCFPLVVKENISVHFDKKIREASVPFSSQKTLQLFKKGLSIAEIAQVRGIISFRRLKQC